MRTTGKGSYYCAYCGYDCTPTTGEPGVADEECPSCDGDFCKPKKRIKKPAAAKAPVPAPTKVKKGEILVELVRGVAGLSLYLNGIRIAGEKPWGGGPIEKRWSVPKKDVRNALMGRNQ